MTVVKSIAVFLVAVLVLGACGLFNKKRQPPCPRISVLDDSRRVVTYAPGGGTDLSAMLNEVRLVGISATCRHRKFAVEVDMELTIAARRGPADRSRRAPVKYFVAIMGPDRKIIAKRVFKVTLAFPVNVDVGALTDTLVQTIPLGPDGRATDYRIIAGLQLTPAQLKFNRDRRKSKGPGDLGDIPISPLVRTRPAAEPDFPPSTRRGGGREVGDPY